MGAQPSTSSNAAVSLKGEITVVAGASQGIGFGIALRFARAGASKFVTETLVSEGKVVVEELKRAGSPGARFFLAELSKKDDILRVADEIKAVAGEPYPDTRSVPSDAAQTTSPHTACSLSGGPARASDNVPGMDQHFAVQVFSRVLLAYELRHTVTRASVAVAVAGKGAKMFDPTDITLDRFKASNASTYAKMMTIRERNATVLDAKELAKDSSPGVQYIHLFPGTVKTNVMANSDQSRFIVWAVWLVGLFVGRTIEQYAEIPFFLAANPQGHKLVEREGGFWDHKLKSVGAAPAAKDDATRKAIWDWLLAHMAR